MKVLLVEDDGVTRRLMEHALQQDGHAVSAVADGGTALDVFADAPCEMLILDWEMPGVDGLTLCRRIREMPGGDTAFVLMVTGRDSVADVTTALAGGVDDYVVKPITPDHLRFRILIARRRLEAEAARRLAETELEEARWKAGVTDALIALQHEINNPLAALLATLELADDDAVPAGEQQAAIVMALKQTHRIVELMRRVSAIRTHRSVEYVPGVRMLDIPGGK